MLGSILCCIFCRCICVCMYVCRKCRITLNKDGKEGRRGRNFPSSSFLIDNGVTSNKQWMTTHPHFQYIMNLARLIPFYSSRSHFTHSIIPLLSNPLTPFSVLPQSILHSRSPSTHGIYVVNRNIRLIRRTRKPQNN